jgi:type 1 glutamine amidotransferase
MIMKKAIISIVCLFLLASWVPAQIQVLIIDGQNNHSVWPKSTMMMKQYLEETEKFTVDIVRTKYTWRATKESAYLPLAGVGEREDMEEPTYDPDFAPEFRNYDVVISNLGNHAADWPEKTQKAFEKYMKNGGGFVSVHAADNSFRDWVEYNKMIGIGGWGGRKPDAGPYIYYTNEGELVSDPSDGGTGKHGNRAEFPVTLRVKDHPITKGMPEVWMSAVDECYALMRGPAENMTILATGKDLTEKAPTDRHEPVMMVLEYGEGRIFHTTMGHADYSFEGVGFIISFLRGVEWVATGKVSIPIPEDFPTANKSSSRKFEPAPRYQELLDQNAFSANPE